MPIDYFQQTMQRNLLKYAAGYAINCPCCGDILDAPTTVHMEDTSGEHARILIMCARCYGRPIGSFTAGAVEVLDGRALWPATGKAARRAWRYKAD